MNRIRLMLCGCLLLLSTCLFAQELEKDFNVVSNSFLAQKEPRYDNQENLCAIVVVSAANMNTYTFENSMIVGNIMYKSGEARIYMAKGAKFLTIKSNKFGVETFNFPEPLEKGTVYKLDLKVVLSEDQKTRTLVMPVAGLGETMSYGAMVGVVKKTGVYAKVKYNFQSFTKDYECNDQGVIAGTDNYNSWFTGNNKIARFAITGGLLQRLWKPAYLYVGAGYGYKSLGWEMEGGEWAENTDNSYKGIEAELGAIYRIKNFALSAGVQTNSFKYWEATVGLGIMF